jgi:hypothetical protein
MLLDVRQPRVVRAHLLRRLRAVRGGWRDQLAARDAILAIACADPDQQLRFEATVALGDFAHDDNVSSVLRRIVADPGESLEQRYLALISLERGGPTHSSMALLASVVGDEDLGKTVSVILLRWQARLRRKPSPL